MLEAITALLIFQLLGEALAYVLAMPLPGPVIGMVALFLCWPCLGSLRGSLDTFTSDLLAHLGLLFVPAAVGVMLHLDLLASWAAGLLLVLVVSTACTMALTAWLFNRIRSRSVRGGKS